MKLLFEMLNVLLLVTALSIDSFFASLAYGTNKIKISFSSAVIINVVCSLILGLSIIVGEVLGKIISSSLTSGISFSIMMLLGITKLFDSTIKHIIKKHEHLNKFFEFSFSGLSFILNVYADPTTADSDDSRSLSITEAVFLAIAMSLDGLIAGVAVIGNINIVLAVLFSFIIGLIVVLSGFNIGRHLSKKFPLDLSWLSGVLFIILAFIKL